MLWRMVAKLLFKASLPLIALAGVMTYGVYMRGGDPAALWQSIAGNSIGQVSRLFSGVRDDASRVVDNVSGAVASAPESGGGQRTEVFTWKDADGVTHFASSRPEDVDAGTVMVDPNVNVLAPVAAPTVRVSHADQGQQDASEAVAEELGGQLPGVAGQVLSTRSSQRRSSAQPGSDAGGGVDVDPAQLLRMLQSPAN